MNFKHPALEFEFHGALHPAVRAALIDLDKWSSAEGLPEVVVTEVLRTATEQEAIYTKHAEAVLARARVKDLPSDQLRKQAAMLQAMTADDIRAWARGRFSWHCVASAADLRNSHYSREQLELVMAHLREGRTVGPWELLSHDVSNGSHIHVGRRDFKWRSTYESSHRNT